MKASTETSLSLNDVLDVVDVAVSAVSRRLPAFIDREDLTSVGKLALVRVFDTVAALPVDEVRAVCYVRVRSAILDELRRSRPESRRKADLMRHVKAAADALRVRNHADPSPERIAEAIGISPKAVRAAMASIAEEQNTEPFRWDSLEDENATAPSDSAEQGDLAEAVLGMLDRLTPGQAAALKLIYLQDMTLEDAAVQIGVSTERVRQLRNAGVTNLRAQFVTLGVWQALIAGKPL